LRVQHPFWYRSQILSIAEGNRQVQQGALDEARAWTAIHSAELWLWFREAGHPEYLERLTMRILNWSDENAQ
jgi:hypothetical protein